MKKIRRGRFRINRRPAQRPAYLRLMVSEPAPSAPIAAPPAAPAFLLRGVDLRNRINYEWAQRFDSLGIPWEYRTRKVELTDRTIPVEFYLSRSKQIVVIRPHASLGDGERMILRRVRAEFAADTGQIDEEGFAAAGIVTVALRSGAFQGIDGEDVALVQCRECEGWWFLDTAGTWKCRCCGAYDGDRHISEWLTGPLHEAPTVPNAGEVA